MLSVSLDLTGYRATVARTIEEALIGIGEAAGTAAREGAAEAKRVGPFQDRTTNLRTNITARFVSSGGNSIEWEIFSPMFYSKWVDSGTSRSRAFPFMPPARTMAETVFYRELRGSLMQRVQRLWV